MNNKIKNMKIAGEINVAAIEEGFKHATPGVSLKQIDLKIEEFILKNGGTPAFKNYHPSGYENPFPATACISPNEVAVHGLPNDYIIKSGDLLTIDVGTGYGGYFVDAARTRVIGNNPKAEELVIATQEILDAQLSLIKDGCNLLFPVHAAELKAKEHNVTIMPMWGGHAIGKNIHEDPFIPSAIDRRQGKISQQIQESRYFNQFFHSGQTICVEPVVIFGNLDIMTDGDGWTVRKTDGNLAAHIERCLLVTDEGYELIS